jgi:hypothetical protein
LGGVLERHQVAMAIELRDHVAHWQTLGRALGKRVEGTEQLHLELTPDPRERALMSDAAWLEPCGAQLVDYAVDRRRLDRRVDVTSRRQSH